MSRADWRSLTKRMPPIGVYDAVTVEQHPSAQPALWDATAA
jgi:hypothetical protein